MANLGFGGGIPQVEPGKAPDSYNPVQASPDAAGAGIGRAAAALGQNVEKAGQNVLAIGDYYDDVATDNALNQYQEKVRSTLHGSVGPDGTPIPGFLSQQGANAMQQRPDVEKQLESYQKEVSNTLKSPHAQQKFTLAADKYRGSAIAQISDHTSKESLTWYKQVNVSTEKNALADIANYADNPEKMAAASSDLISARVKNLQLDGLGDNLPARRLAIDSAKQDALTAQTEAIAVKDPARAMSILEKNRDIAGQKYDELANKYRARKEEQVGTSVADAELTASAINPTIHPIHEASDKILDAIIQQESNGNPNIPPSSAGAIGLGQIMPDTFKRYAQEGERIDNPTDNLAVAKRITTEYMQKYGDPARVAVAYFSGEGNVAPPGSAQPFISDKTDKTGKSTSSYVADVIERSGLDGPEPQLTRLSNIRSDAISRIQARTDLNDNEKNHAYTKIEQTYRLQKVATEQDAAAKKARNDDTADKYTQAMLKTGGVTPDMLEQIRVDPNLTWQTRDTLTKAALEQSGSDVEKGQKAYGSGFWDAYKQVTAPAGDPSRIIDTAPLFQRAGPGGDLTLAGVQKLIQTQTEMSKPENSATAEMKKGALAYAKSQLSFEFEIGSFKMADPNGRDDFNAKFIPAFYDSFDKGVQSGKTPYQLLSKDSPDYIVDKLVSTYKRSDSQLMKDKMDAGMSAADPTVTKGKVDISTPQGLKEAVRRGQMTQEEGVAEALKRGYIRASQSVTAPNE